MPQLPSPHYLALLQGPAAAGPGAEPAWKWPPPAPPRPVSRLTRVKARSTSYLMRVSHIWDPQLPALAVGAAETLTFNPQLRASRVCSGALPATQSPQQEGQSCQARLLPPVTSWKLEAFSWNHFQEVTNKTRTNSLHEKPGDSL